MGLEEKLKKINGKLSLALNILNIIAFMGMIGIGSYYVYKDYKKRIKQAVWGCDPDRYPKTLMFAQRIHDSINDYMTLLKKDGTIWVLNNDLNQMEIRHMYTYDEEVRKKISIDGIVLNDTYYHQGMSILRLYPRENPADAFQRLDEGILDLLLYNECGMGVKAEQMQNPPIDAWGYILLPEMSKREKAELVSKHYLQKWQVWFREGKFIYWNKSTSGASIEPISGTYLQTRIMWDFVSEYKLFLSPGAPPEELEKYLIENVKHVFVVDKKKKTSRLYIDGLFVEEQPVATGLKEGDREIYKDFRTPEGVFMVISKELCNEDLMQRGYGPVRFGLETRWMWGDFQSGIYFHGTIHPESIGNNASEGCIRFSNEAILDYYNRIPAYGAIMIIKSGEDHPNRNRPYEEPNLREAFKKMRWRLIPAKNSLEEKLTTLSANTGP